MKYTEQERRFRIGISGSYGGLNLGDEAILQVIVSQLRRDLPVEITVFSRNPRDTLQRHQVDHAVPVRDCSRGEIRPPILAKRSIMACWPMLPTSWWIASMPK